MRRLCERPGCSEHADVAYGMRTEDLVFWIDVIGEGPGPDRGVLCRRHADSMIVPRGWTLDDLRDPHLHLFRPPPRPDARTSTARRRKRGDGESAEQLALTTDAGLQPPIGDDIADESGPEESGADAPPAAALVDDSDAAVPWNPTFDDADDLGGLLSARSPLLSRAFRVTERSD